MFIRPQSRAWTYVTWASEMLGVNTVAVFFFFFYSFEYFNLQTSFSALVDISSFFDAPPFSWLSMTQHLGSAPRTNPPCISRRRQHRLRIFCNILLPPHDIDYVSSATSCSTLMTSITYLLQHLASPSWHRLRIFCNILLPPHEV